MADVLDPIHSPARVYTWFSLSPDNEDINRVIELGYYDDTTDRDGFVQYEGTFCLGGQQFGYSLLSGLTRAAFGLAQIVGTVFFAVIRLLQAGFAGICGDKELAALRASEALRSVTYLGHGLANFGRGLVEAAQLVALAKRCGYHVNLRYFLYQSEKADIATSPVSLDAKEVKLP